MAAASISTDAAYNIPYGCRFNSGDSTLLTRTNSGTPSDASKGILSGWFKRSDIGILNEFWCAPNEDFHIGITTGDQIGCNDHGAETLRSTQVFRDPSAWFHVVCSYDSDQAIVGDRIQIYFNGERITDFAYYAPSNTSLGEAWGMNADGVVVRIGNSYASSGIWGGYMADNLMIDGKSIQNGDYSIVSFGEFNNNVWRPIDVTGLTFGTNGWLMDFANSSALGNDVSGNDNDFASSGFDAADQVVDTPTLNYPTFASNMGRYVTSAGDASTLSNGNLDIVGAESAVSICDVNFVPLNTGKWYFTWLHDARNNMNNDMGITNEDNRSGKNGALSGGYIGAIGAVLVGLEGANQMSVQSADFTNITATFPVTSTTSDQTVMAVDIDNLKLWAGFWDQSADNLYWLANDGSWSSANVDVPATGSSETCAITGTGLTFFSQNYGTRGGSVDFGSINGGILANITTPSGFKQLNTANLPEPTIKNSKKYFDTILYEGNGYSQKIGQFQPITETYSVGNSALFIGPSTCELEKTFGSAASSTQKGTLSVWLKPNDAGMGSSGGHIMNSDGTGGDFLKIDDGIIKIQMNNEGEGAWVSTTKILDRTQWTNLVVAYETDNASATDRIQIYVNGINITDDGSFTATVTDSGFDIFQNGIACNIGGVSGYASASYIYDGYMAEYVWCDGQVLTPSSFGEVDSTTNRWIPKDVSGLTFGNNGFYLDFADKNDLGDDESGNTNDWAESGFDTTNGSNQYYDTPTRNFAIMDPGRTINETMTLGNLLATSGGATGQVRTPNAFGLTSGKWYWEFLMTNGSTNERTMYITQDDVAISATQIRSTTGHYSGYYSYDGDAMTPGNVTSTTGEGTDYGTTYTSGDVISCALDLDIGAIWWGKNGTWQNSATEAEIEGGDTSKAAQTGLASGRWYPTMQNNTTQASQANFGQHIYYDSTTLTLDTDAGGYFRHAVPDGFKAVHVDNLTESDSFQSAFSWIKNRDAADAHMLFDRVRGPYSFWNSDDDANITDDINTLTRFLKQGVNIGNDVRVNTTSESYALWDWFIESTGSGASNEDGTINTTSTLVDTTGGISISKFTGTGANATVGHGLGVAPKFLILKHFDNSSYSTPAWHNQLPTPTTALFYFDNSDAKSAAATAWNSTIPTSTVVSLGSGASTNNSSTAYMMYCFAEIVGYSRFGSYTGNGSADGPVIYTGFKPAYVMIKKSSGAGNWVINDSARSPFNEIDDQLLGNTTAAETTGSEEIDFLGSGFKIRGPDSDTNSSAGFYVYMAWASNPFGGASTTPSTAF